MSGFCTRYWIRHYSCLRVYEVQIALSVPCNIMAILVFIQWYIRLCTMLSQETRSNTKDGAKDYCSPCHWMHASSEKRILDYSIRFDFTLEQWTRWEGNFEPCAHIQPKTRSNLSQGARCAVEEINPSCTVVDHVQKIGLLRRRVEVELVACAGEWKSNVCTRFKG